MKKIFAYRFYLLYFLLGFLDFVFPTQSNAQKADNYTFNTTITSTLIDMTGSSSLLLPSLQPQSSAVLPLGFEMWFMGTRFTSFSVCANGVVQLGQNPIDANANHYAITALPRIVALASGERNKGNFVIGNTGKVHYKTIGNAPNRTLVIEWLNIGVGIDSKTVDATFQILLNETAPLPMTTQGGRIELRYGQVRMEVYATMTAVSVGIGLGNNFKAVEYDAQPPAATLNEFRGVLNQGTVPTLHSTQTTARRMFSFESPAPNGNVFNVKPSTVNNKVSLQWQEDATNEVGYVIYKSTDGNNYSFLTQVNNSLSYIDTTTTPCKTYFYRVYTVTEGKLGVLQPTAAIRYEIDQGLKIEVEGQLFACETAPTSNPTLQPKAPNNTKFINYFWLNSLGDTVGTSDRFSPTKVGQYTLVGMQADSCTVATNFVVTACCLLDVVLPTAFTPFNTPANNLYKARCINCEEFTMQIFNRWGMLVFESNNVETGWNGGLFNGNPLQGDAYQVVISYSGCENGETVRKTKREVVYLLE